MALFPDDCTFRNPQHIDFLLPAKHYKDIRQAICWEFVFFFVLLIIVLFIFSPKFQIWIVFIGSYFVLALLLGMISVVSFGVLFSLLYLVDRSLSIHLENKEVGYKSWKGDGAK